MLLLILFSDHLKRTLRMNALAEQGILFWSAMYIPIVVAMAAQQDVVAAVKGGPAALIAGVLAVVLSFALVPVIARIGQPVDERNEMSAADAACALPLKSGE